MEKSAVEWLVDTLTQNGTYPFMLTEDVVAIKKANEIFQKQIERAYHEGQIGIIEIFEEKFDISPNAHDRNDTEDAIEYYQQTFGKKE